MARIDTNRSGEMEVFVRVGELGSLSAAARAFRMTPSAVSKLVARLESRLGVPLLNRSTRRVQLTPEGSVFLERSTRVLADIEAAEREVSSGIAPRGKLRVSCNVPFGIHRLLPRLPRFLSAHPQVTVDVALTDVVVDLFEVRADVAIRLGPLADSRLLARKLGESRMVVVASKAYLAARGTPRAPADLAEHECLGFCFIRQAKGWPFIDRSRRAFTFVPKGNALVSDGEAMRQLALAGAGIARLSMFHVGADIEAGRLVPLLDRFNPRDVEAAHAVFLGHDGRMPARVRAFLDFLTDSVRLT